MLFPMLEGFAKGGFQGFGPNGLTYDWKAWDALRTVMKGC